MHVKKSDFIEKINYLALKEERKKQAEANGSTYVDETEVEDPNAKTERLVRNFLEISLIFPEQIKARTC